MPSAWGELDHVIFFCDAGAPEAGALLDLGLYEGPGNSHPGQGTANRRFFFPNAYLELLWVENFTEAQSSEALPTQLWDRWRARADSKCPFGLVFRPGECPPPPAIPSWTYAPRYFPPGFSIEVASDIPANEPLLFYLPFARPALVEERRPVPGIAEIGAVVGVTVHLPDSGSVSPALNALVKGGVVAVEPAREYLLDLHYVGGSAQIFDMRPRLALRFLPARAMRDARH